MLVIEMEVWRYLDEVFFFFSGWEGGPGMVPAHLPPDDARKINFPFSTAQRCHEFFNLFRGLRAYHTR